MCENPVFFTDHLIRTRKLNWIPFPWIANKDDIVTLPGYNILNNKVKIQDTLNVNSYKSWC